MNQPLASLLLAIAAALAVPAHAQSEVSTAVSMLPVASAVVGVASLASANGDRSASATTAGSMLLMPAALIIEAVKVSGTKTVYVLKRASDGASVAVEVLGTGA